MELSTIYLLSFCAATIVGVLVMWLGVARPNGKDKRFRKKALAAGNVTTGVLVEKSTKTWREGGSRNPGYTVDGGFERPVGFDFAKGTYRYEVDGRVYSLMREFRVSGCLAGPPEQVEIVYDARNPAKALCACATDENQSAMRRRGKGLYVALFLPIVVFIVVARFLGAGTP